MSDWSRGSGGCSSRWRTTSGGWTLSTPPRKRQARRVPSATSPTRRPPEGRLPLDLRLRMGLTEQAIEGLRALTIREADVIRDDVQPMLRVVVPDA
jgi:hypothetical protein